MKKNERSIEGERSPAAREAANKRQRLNDDRGPGRLPRGGKQSGEVQDAGESIPGPHQDPNEAQDSKSQ